MLQEEVMQISGLLFLILAIVSSASMTLALKLFQAGNNNRYAILLGNYITCILIGFILLRDKTSVFHGEPAARICGLLGGILFVVSLVLMQRSIEINGAVLTSAFSRLGLVVPLVISILFLGEHPRAVQIAGLAVVLAAMWVINGRREEGTDSSPVILIFVLLGGGLADGMAKIFSHFGSGTQDDLYIFYVFCTAGFLTVFLLLKEYKSSGKTGRLRDYMAGIAVGIPNYFSSLFLLKSLDAVPAFIAYTVFSTGTLLTVTAVSVLCLKERLTRYQAVGIIMIIAALVFLNI